MKYNTAIHTLEIQPIMKPEHEACVKDWWNKLYKKDLAFINSKWTAKDGTPRLVINPHRLHTTADGNKYVFTYGGLEEHLADMQTVCTEMEIDSYIIRRLDVCLDVDIAYEQTQKITRLITFLLGDRIGAENRYISYDPLTLEPKTLRLENGSYDRNGKIIYPTRQIEHYNRELINQTTYDGKPILNRFELRAMGRAAGLGRTEQDIVASWLDELEALRERQISEVHERVNRQLIKAYRRYSGLAGNMGSTEINNFIKAHADYIYTRTQLIELLSMLEINDPKHHAANLITRSGKLFELYKPKQIMGEIDCMKTALKGFIGQK